MRAMQLATLAPAESHPLTPVEREVPVCADDELRVRVEVCGVCRTDLHVVEGELLPRRPTLIPGHQVVGRVEALGSSVEGWKIGERVGAAWLRRTCGRCRFCARDAENLCLAPVFTGWDADGVSVS